jgi:2-polyprenyl-3-methyl-5-hydroxy-6-metoxy-1,4-benzoquinol methylase
MNIFDKDYYDEKYIDSDEYKKHYAESVYYPVWDCVKSSLLTDEKILDVGCGCGHLASMLLDNGFYDYTGVDFSSVAVGQAKREVPEFKFVCADLNDFDFAPYADHAIVATEVFEHIEDDIALIKRLPKNKIVFSVPNFEANGHVRTYPSLDYITERYKDVIDIYRIESFGRDRVKFKSTQGSPIIFVVIGEVIR